MQAHCVFRSSRRYFDLSFETEKCLPVNKLGVQIAIEANRTSPSRFATNIKLGFVRSRFLGIPNFFPPVVIDSK